MAAGRPRDTGDASVTFVPGDIRRCLAMTAGVTALGTRLFAPFGAGRSLDRARVNQVKKDADAISAYVMSEALWHLTRKLPENHAIMVCLGEGLMPKAGETPEMGANPLLGFGRVYARPQVARFLDARVHRLLNDPDYDWPDFYRKMREQGITIWGAAIDTLENTSRFAKGEERGPMTVLHLFDQPLVVARPYEAYMGTLAVPAARDARPRGSTRFTWTSSPRAASSWRRSSWRSPGSAESTSTSGPSAERAGSGGSRRLWEEWRDLGVHVVEDGWVVPERDARVQRVGHLRAPPTWWAPGRTTAGPPICSSATDTRPPRRRCRPRASPRSSTWTSPWPSTHRTLN